MYRKAEGVTDHLHRVTVPPIRIIDTEEAIRLKKLASE